MTNTDYWVGDTLGNQYSANSTDYWENDSLGNQYSTNSTDYWKNDTLGNQYSANSTYYLIYTSFRPFGFLTYKYSKLFHIRYM